MCRNRISLNKCPTPVSWPPCCTDLCVFCQSNVAFSGWLDYKDLIATQSLSRVLIAPGKSSGEGELGSPCACLGLAAVVEEEAWDRALMAVPPRSLNLGLFSPPWFASDWCEVIISEPLWVGDSSPAAIGKEALQWGAEGRCGAEPRHTWPRLLWSHQSQAGQGFGNVSGEKSKALVCFCVQGWKWLNLPCFLLFLFWELAPGACIHLHRLTKLLCILYKRSLLIEILGPKLGQAVGLAFWGEGFAYVWAETHILVLS